MSAAERPGGPDGDGHRLWLVRHGETEWSRLGRHTGRTDVPLTSVGRLQATALRGRIAGQRFAAVWSSPRSRALDTARLAGFDNVHVDPDLAEWDYGRDEGRTTAEIDDERPGWRIWRDGVEAGETVEAVGVRADRVIERATGVDGDVLVFAHGHLLRILTARWLGLAAIEGRLFALGTAALSVLGWEREQRVIERWNEACDPD